MVISDSQTGQRLFESVLPEDFTVRASPRTVADGVDSWGGGYGFYVMIDHGDGDETLYAHCSYVCVTYGQTVQKGEVIAYVGSTGNSTGNQLHFEIRVNGKKRNPLNWLRKKELDDCLVTVLLIMYNVSNKKF